VEPAPNACPVPLSPHTAGPCGFSPHRSSAMTRLDRLARSTRDLLNIVAEIREAGAGFKSLSDAWADTTTPHGRLLMVVLGGLAEFERDLIAARTGEGRARAKARGVKFGRPPALTPHQRSEALQRLREGATQADLARTYGVSQATISRLEPRPFVEVGVADHAGPAAP
jgi:DNA invertase Pin-like site-specific DNA recombinase